MHKSLIAKIQKEFKKIKSRYQKKYGAVVFDAGVKISRNGFLLLEGKILSKKQKQEVFFAAKEILEKNISKFSNKFETAGKKRAKKRAKATKDKITIKNTIKVVANPDDKLEIGWAVIKSDVVDLRSFFKKTSGNTSEGRATQALRGDIVRLLAQKANQFLVQTNDLAIGWVKREDIVKTKDASLIRKWKKTKRMASAGQKIKIAKIEGERKKFVAFLEKYFNAPYLTGGVTEKGIDCSGLTQKFYSEIFGILLPKHSTDQAALGREINFAQSRFGDLVFLRHREKKYPHIGIVVDTNGKIDNFLILNARRDNGGVIIQSFSEVLKSYKLINTRRIIEYFREKTD